MLYLVYFVMFFSPGTQVNCLSKIFEYDPNNNCTGISAEFSKFVVAGEAETCGVQNTLM